MANWRRKGCITIKRVCDWLEAAGREERPHQSLGRRNPLKYLAEQRLEEVS